MILLKKVVSNDGFRERCGVTAAESWGEEREQLGVHILKYCRHEEERKKKTKWDEARCIFIGIEVGPLIVLGDTA